MRFTLHLEIVVVLLCIFLYTGCTLHVNADMQLDKEVYIKNSKADTNDKCLDICDLRENILVINGKSDKSEYCKIKEVSLSWRNGFCDIDFSLVNNSNLNINIDVKDIKIYIEKGWKGKSPGPMQSPATEGDIYVPSGALLYPSSQFDKRVIWLNEQVERNKVHGILENDGPTVSPNVSIVAGGMQRIKVLFPVDFYSRAYAIIPYTMEDHMQTKEIAVLFFTLKGTIPHKWKERIEEAGD